MRRLFATNLLFVLGVNLLVKPIWIFGIDRQVQNLVGHQDFGLYMPLMNLCLIFQILLDFGINNYTTKQVSEDPARLPLLFPAMFTARLTLMLLFGAVVLATAWALGYRSGPQLVLLCGIIGFQSLNMLMMFLRANVAALQRFKIDGLLSVADRGLMILVCGLLLSIPASRAGFTIYTFVWVQLACYGAAALLALVVLRRLTHIPFRLELRPAQLWPVFQQSFPYALLIFLMAIYLRSDSLLLARLLPELEGREQAGIYAAAYRPLEAFNMLAVLLAGILLPLFTRMLAERASVAPIVKLAMNLIFPLSILASAISFGYGQHIMELLYPIAGPGEGRVFGWLMATVPAYAILYIYSTLLTAGARLRQLHRISLLGIGVNLSLCFVLIPRLGALGAAIAACATMWAVAVCFILTAHREFRLPHNPRWISALMGYGACVASLAWASTQLHYPWMSRMGAMLAVGAVLLFVFRFIDVQGAMRLVRK